MLCRGRLGGWAIQVRHRGVERLAFRCVFTARVRSLLFVQQKQSVSLEFGLAGVGGVAVAPPEATGNLCVVLVYQRIELSAATKLKHRLPGQTNRNLGKAYLKNQGSRERRAGAFQGALVES